MENYGIAMNNKICLYLEVRKPAPPVRKNCQLSLLLFVLPCNVSGYY